MTLQGREIYGHTAYLSLTQSLEFPSTYLPLQYDRDDRIRRESTMLKLKQIASSNPYKVPFREQIIFIGVASFYASFGWYQVLLGQENLTNGEILLCSVLSFGCLWGMYGTYYVNVERNLNAYSKCLQRIRMFRENTTQAAIKKYDADRFRPSRGLEGLEKDEDFDMMVNLKAWFKLYQYLGDSTVGEIYYFQSETTASFFIMIGMAVWCFYISLTYEENKQRVFLGKCNLSDKKQIKSTCSPKP